MTLGPGKLDPSLLARLLGGGTVRDPHVLLGPGVGLDCAVLDLGHGRCLVAKSDPITFATDEIGWYAVQVNANDVATTGAEPRWFLATLLLPHGGADEALVGAIFEQLHAACDALGVTLVGGHTEVTHGLDRPVLAGTMLGEVRRDRLVLPTGARAGDVVVLTKRPAVEATAILARERAGALAGRVDPQVLARARAFLHHPGISVLAEARAAVSAGGVHAMHDVTEGGLATGLRELAEASGVGIAVDGAAVAPYPETAALCAPFGIDPWGAIGSGSLLLAVAAADAQRVLRAIAAAGVEARPVGRVVAGDECTVSGRPLPVFARDEITKAFAG